MEIIDYLLARKKAGGGSDVTIEQLSVTENGTYSEEGIAYSPVVVNVPAPANSYQLKDVPSGTVSTIDDGTALPMSSLKVGMEPVQDLHGYDHPWAEGSGKNKLQVTATSQTVDGIAFTINNDGTINVNGTATQDISLLLSRKNVSDTPLPEGQLTMTGCPSGGSTSSYYLTCWRTNSGNANDVGDGVTFGYRSDWDFVVSLVIASGTTCNNLIFKPMIRLATETDSTFEPYSNICPISGWTAANVTRTGKNLFDESILLECSGWTVSDGVYSGTSGYIHDKYSNGVPNLAFKPNTQYTFSFTYGQDGPAGNALVVIIRYTDNTIAPKYCTLDSVGFNSVTSTEGKSIAKLELSYGSNRTIHLSNMQLEEGSTATTYEPYNGTTYTIQFRDGDNPLTVYGGTLDVTSGELTVTKKYIIFDGSNDEEWLLYADPSSNINQLYMTISNIATSSGISGGNTLCDKFKSISIDNRNGNFNTCYAGRDGICFNIKDFTVEMWRNWLIDNNVTVTYTFKTPITYHLTPTQVRTLVGNNNIWADTGDIIEGKYFKSLV